MKSILFISKKIHFQDIDNKLSPEFKIDLLVDFDYYITNPFKRSYDFVFIDLIFLPADIFSSLKIFSEKIISLKNTFNCQNIIVLSDNHNIKNAVTAVKAGAINYITYPVEPSEIILIINETYKNNLIHSELKYFRNQLNLIKKNELFISKSKTMIDVLNKIKTAASTDTTILLTGETGTGKSVIAKYIHNSSKRKDSKFIGLHCGAIPETLIESDLFGHEKGAFTGAFKRKLGKFEIAQGGTIFLDEIGTINNHVQIKLLQILQEKQFQRIGGEEFINSDCRIITATNSDLLDLVNNNIFRKDLYYRLNVFQIEIPPLRRRKEDIPLFVNNFIDKLNNHYLKNINYPDNGLLKELQKYHWPGNIRELENVIERAYILETSKNLSKKNFPKDIFEQSYNDVDIIENFDKEIPVLKKIKSEYTDKIEKKYLHELLIRFKGKINQSAKAANISTRQFSKLLKKYNINKNHYK